MSYSLRAHPDMKAVFLLGLSSSSDPAVNRRVEEEARVHGDILVQDFVDTYANLTAKSLMMVKFVQENRIDAKFVFKLDDDVFLNVPVLARTLHDVEKNSSSMILGFMLSQTSPIRWAFSWRPETKWICPTWLYSHDLFPPYMDGPGYLISVSLLPCLYRAAMSTPMLSLEDVYLTGVLAGKCEEATLVHLPQMIMWKGHQLIETMNATNFFLKHPVDEDEHRRLHQIVLGATAMTETVTDGSAKQGL